MRILVTGATGFLGRKIVASLSKQGADLRVLLRPKHKGLQELAERQIFLGDVGDPQSIAAAARGCDVLVHAAGLSDAHASAHALSWLNVAGTENVINAARHVGVRKLIFISCADATLTNRDRVNWNEQKRSNRPLLSAYVQSKLLAEEVACASSDRSMEVIVLSPAWVWGPDDTSRLPWLCAEIQEKGAICLPGSGKNYFATLHIDSLLQAVDKSIQAQGAGGNVYLLSDLCLATAAEFFGGIAEAFGASIKTGSSYALNYAEAFLREKLGLAGLWRSDVILRGRSTLFDVSRAAECLNFSPRQSLDADMTEFENWAKQSKGLTSIAKLTHRPKTT
ncbi:MAG: NAD-dependent epimerase/dehydratase family protein [Myxococcales bacterium]|nr:MAG: NAD-dependent epimerase/dehydratase family protein [Myxococcales bacterium]